MGSPFSLFLDKISSKFFVDSESLVIFASLNLLTKCQTLCEVKGRLMASLFDRFLIIFLPDSFAVSLFLRTFALLNLNKLYYGTQTKRKKWNRHLSRDA